MTDKEKTIKELKEALDSLDITNKYRLNIIRAIEYLQEEPVSKQKLSNVERTGKNWKEPVSEDLEEVSEQYMLRQDTFNSHVEYQIKGAFKAGAKWQRTKDESTTEDLGDYINKLSKQFPEVSFAKLSRIAVRVVKWQKEQEYTCYEEAFEDGAKWKNEQVTSKTINFLEMLGQGFTITDEITHNPYKVEQLITDFKNYIKD